MLDYCTKDLIPTTQSLTTVENLKCNVMPSGCRNELSQKHIQSGCRLYKAVSGPRTPVLESANGLQKPWGFGRVRGAWQHNGEIMKWGCASGWLPRPCASSRCMAPALSRRISQSIIAWLESVIGRLNGRFGNSTWQTRLTSMVRDCRQHWMSSQRLALAEWTIGSKEPQLRRSNLCTMVCISLPRSFLCCCEWCVDTVDDKEETSGHKASQKMVRCNASTDFLLEPISYAITYVDPDIAGKRVGENHTQFLPWHWTGDDESILPIVTSIVYTIILSIVNIAIAALPDPSWTVWELWGCREEPHGVGGPYAPNDTPIFDTNTAAGWVQAAMTLWNSTCCCVVYRGQQADGTAGAQTSMRGGRSDLPLDDVFPPRAEDMINDIGVESEDDGETRCSNWRSFLTTKIRFQ